MNEEFPGAVPEIPVRNVDEAAVYYEKCFGFTKDWGGEEGGIGQVSKGSCRIFLTNSAFREQYGNAAPVLVWLNLNSKKEVDDLFEIWNRNAAHIVSEPESKPWHCMSSRQRIQMAISFVFSTISLGSSRIAEHEAVKSLVMQCRTSRSTRSRAKTRAPG